MIKKTIVSAFILLAALQSYGQKGWEVGPWIGVSNYFGDLNSNFDFTEVGAAAGAIGRYNWNNRVSSKMSLNYAFVYGDDEDSQNSFEKRRKRRKGLDWIRNRMHSVGHSLLFDNAKPNALSICVFKAIFTDQ